VFKKMTAISQMQAIRDQKLSLYLQEQAAVKAVQMRKIALTPTANKKAYDPKALEFIVFLLLISL
jgi:hypothetical protein